MRHIQGLRDPLHGVSSSKGNGGRNLDGFLEGLHLHRLFAQETLRLPHALLKLPEFRSADRLVIHLHRDLASLALVSFLQRKRRLDDMPCLRATYDMLIPGRHDSFTIRSFSTNGWRWHFPHHLHRRILVSTMTGHTSSTTS